MKLNLNYDRENDSLYIDLDGSPSVKSQEISDDLVVDYGEDGRIVGIDIQHANDRASRPAPLETQQLLSDESIDSFPSLRRASKEQLVPYPVRLYPSTIKRLEHLKESRGLVPAELIRDGVQHILSVAEAEDKGK